MYICLHSRNDRIQAEDEDNVIIGDDRCFASISAQLSNIATRPSLT